MAFGERWNARRPDETVAEYAERTGMDRESAARMFGGVHNYRPTLDLDQLRERHPHDSEAELLARFRENRLERYRASRVRNAVVRYHRTDDGMHDPRSMKELLADWRSRGIMVPKFGAMDEEGNVKRIPLAKWSDAERKFLSDVLQLSDEEIWLRYRV